MNALMRFTPVYREAGIYHFESIPVLLDLADESAREMRLIAETHSNQF